MKKFGEGQQPFHAIIDIPEGDSQELTTVTDQALNSLYGELFNLLQTHGINPTATTNADLKQVARAVWAAVNAGTLFIDSGTANVKNLTHTKGVNFLYRDGNSGDNGFIIEFLNKIENTGAVTVNIFDVENNQNHFNSVPLVDANGNAFPAKALPVGTMVKAYYDYATNSFKIINIYNANVSDSLVFNAENKALRGVTMQTIDSIAELGGLTKIQGRTVFAKSYHAGLGIGGGVFVYDESKANLNDGMVNFGGWVRQYERLNITMAGAKGNGNDDSQSLKIATALSVQLKKSLYIDVDISISSGVDLRATMRIIGDGGALQGSRKIICLNDTAAFYVIGGFSSESSVFENLQFCAKTGGTGAGFGQRADGYLSQTSFTNCTFDRSLRYGIDANIILCDFYKCDFGSYTIADNQVGYKAIRSIGNSGYEPNANLFTQCIFRNGNDNYMIEYLAYGTQWQFINCDFEQNKCNDSVIYAEAAGSIFFNGGYVEANKTPYFIKTGGNQMIGFVNTIIFQSLLFNNPAQKAICKNLNPTFAKFSFESCYGRLLCAMWEDNTGAFNDLKYLSKAIDCNFVLGTGGNVGQVRTLTNVNGFNTYDFNVFKPQLSGESKRNVLTFYKLQSLPIARLDSAVGDGYSFGGIIEVFVGSGDRDGGINAASYTLQVSIGGINDLKVIGKAGLVDGAVATYPSFDFSIDGNRNIIAKALVETSGKFMFVVKTQNNTFKIV